MLLLLYAGLSSVQPPSSHSATVYNRRSAPVAYQKGWVDGETSLIQRAIASAATNSTPDGTGFVRVASGVYSVPSALAVSDIPGATRLSSDKSTSGAAFVTSGLSFPVLGGESWTAHWRLWIATSAAAAGGVAFQVTYPSISGVAVGQAHGIRTSAYFDQMSTASPLSFPTGLGNTDLSATNSWVTIEVSFDAFSAAGTVDLQFKNVSGGETMIIRRASVMLINRTN